VDRTKHHGLMVMTIALFAVLSGAGFGDRNLWQTSQQWLESFCSCPMGYRRTIPLHGCLALEPKEFKDSFLSWVSSITERLGIEFILTAKPRFRLTERKTQSAA